MRSVSNTYKSENETQNTLTDPSVSFLMNLNSNAVLVGRSIVTFQTG